MSQPAEGKRLSRISFWLLIGMIALIGVSKTVISDTLDPDLFWHLRVAEQLQREGIHPLVDQMSFQSMRAPWTPYSWLAELGMKWAWDHFGYRAAIIGEALMVTALVFLIAASCLTYAGADRRVSCVLG